MMAGNSQSDRLAQLRTLAQHHLAEVEIEKAEEEAQMTQAEADIQRYSKMSSFDRKKLSSTNKALPREQRSQPVNSTQTTPNSAVAVKQDRFPPFHEILHRMKWDPKLNIDDYVVGYLERFEGVKEMPARSWIRDFSDEDWIPMHRVRYVKRVRALDEKDEEDPEPELGMVWDRDSRIDKISKTNGAYEDQTQSRSDILSLDGTSVTGGVAL